MKKAGLGNKPQAAEALTEIERDTLYQRSQLGTHRPQAVMNALWLNNTIHFGLRGIDEHRQLQWGDGQLHEDSDGQQDKEFNERDTKNAHR